MLAHSLEGAHRGRVCVCALIALVGYRVPAKPLRFELWGARKDLILLKHALNLAAILASTMNNTRDTRFILVWATVVV